MEVAQVGGDPAPRAKHICQAEHAGWLATPLRRLMHNPEKILRGLIEKGQTVVDLGCGPGYFTLPMARLVGEKGLVIAVDLQQEMLDRLRQRAEHAGLMPRIRLHKCEADRIGVRDLVDFALAFYMVHEVVDAEEYLRQVHDLLKAHGRLLLVEPKVHVSASAFGKTVEVARRVGLTVIAEPRIALSRAVLMER